MPGLLTPASWQKKRPYRNILNKYPTIIMPPVQIPTNNPNNFGFIAFLSIIIEGRLSVVTAIIKLRIVPS